MYLSVILYLISGLFLITPIPEHGTSQITISKLFKKSILHFVASCSYVLILSISSFFIFSWISFNLCIYLSHEIKLELKYLLAICRLFPPGAAHVSNMLYLVLTFSPIAQATRELASS